jgi:ribulose-bisphosphate carboxylase large chain
MTAEEIGVVYRLRTTSANVASRAEALLLEQTVELPRSTLPTPFVREHLLGRIVATEAAGEGDYRVTLAQPAVSAAGDPAQLLNVLFGNCSLQADVELEDVRLPPSLVRMLRGPRFGIPGLRQLTGVHGRALTASVLKPVGLSVPETAALCGTLALSGLDIVKDDHGLADHVFSPFEERVRACVAATQDAAQKTGKRTLYVPNLIGAPRTVLNQARLAKRLGAAAVMVSPMLLGLPFLTELAGDLGLPILAHPAFGGSLRIAPAALLGRLFPLFGADAVIYPNAGGRFSYSREVCGGIATALRHPADAIQAAFPVPAGGMRLDGIPESLGYYGPDTILLVGGSILATPGLDAILARGRQFVASVHAYPYPP